MATISAKVYKHHRKSDGTYNVKICIYHNSQRVFIDTEHYVAEKKVSKDLKIKDPFINALLNKTLDDYRIAVSDLGPKLPLFDAQGLKDYLTKKDDVIDFMAFGQIHIDMLKSNGQTKHAGNYNTVLNHLRDFFRKDKYAITDISIRTLDDFVRFLRTNREIERKVNKAGDTRKIIAKRASDASIHNYLRDFSGLFSAAMEYYNKPSLGITPVTYNPFSEFKIIEAPVTRKRNITIEDVVKIRNCEVEENSRAELARDMFMLSFYLCGINAVDLYKFDFKIKNGRIEYNRSKTQGKRKDNAFISIKIPREAIALVNKYKNILSERYASITNLNKALSKGMCQIRDLTGIEDVTYYWARHTFGNLARNKCRKSKDDVALALNHVDQGRTTTDIYLEKDWSIIDEVQEAVISLLREYDMMRGFHSLHTNWIAFKDISLPIVWN